LVESLVRLAVGFVQGRPIGNLAGHIIWAIGRQLHRAATRARGGTVEPERSFWQVEPATSERELQDAYHMREPYLALLSVDEQIALAHTFGFDGIKWGKATAWTLLIAIGPMFVGTLIGIFLVPEAPEVLLLLATGYMTIEQVFRLKKLARRELAPS